MSRQIVQGRKTYSLAQQSPFDCYNYNWTINIRQDLPTPAATRHARPAETCQDPLRPTDIHWHLPTPTNTRRQSTPSNTGKYPLKDSWRGAVNLLRCNMKACYPFWQMRNMEFLQFRVKSEVTDDLRFFCMWLNSLYMYTGNLNISYH